MWWLEIQIPKEGCDLVLVVVQLGALFEHHLLRFLHGLLRLEEGGGGQRQVGSRKEHRSNDDNVHGCAFQIWGLVFLPLKGL